MRVTALLYWLTQSCTFCVTASTSFATVTLTVVALCASNEIATPATASVTVFVVLYCVAPPFTAY